MTDNIILRPETDGDHAAIHTLTAEAFAPMPFCDGTEADAIDILRRDGQLTLSLVAELDGVIVGQVTFAPALQPTYGVPDRTARRIGSRSSRRP